MTDVGRMSKREARKAVRAHWITYILNADCAFGCDQAVADVWVDECQRIASRIDSRKPRP